MKFGTYFAYWEQEWDVDFVPYCKRVAGLGFDILEVSGAGLAELTDVQLQRLRDAANDAGITLTACAGLPRMYDIASTDETIRKNGIAYLEKLFLQMEKVGIRSLGGVLYSYWPYDYSCGVHKKQAWERSVTSMRELAGKAQGSGITLMMETVNRFEQFMFNDAAEAVSYVKDVGEENVKVMLDSFHMNIEEDDMGEAIRNTGDYLGHFHIGECNRKVPGKGHMQWDEMGQALRDIDYKGAVVMEPFVRMGGTVGSDIKVWRDLSEGADNQKLDSDIREALDFVKRKFVR